MLYFVCVLILYIYPLSSFCLLTSLAGGWGGHYITLLCVRIGKFTKTRRELGAQYSRLKTVRTQIKNFDWLQTCSLGRGKFSDLTFKFQMFSNDILNGRIVTKAVTEKTVTNLNLNFKFLFNVKFGSWAFRNCAYFVMEPSGCDTVRLSV